MFLPIIYESLNKVTALRPGLYGCNCCAYKSPKDALKAFIFEFSLIGKNDVIACDMLILDAAGDLFFRDFMLMPDRTWRDSYGARADSISALLPSEIFGYELIECFALEAQKVGEWYA